MKLYDFEKHFLWLVLYKIYCFFKEVWEDKGGRTILIIVWFFGALIIAVVAIIYFFVGVNVFLEKVHLEKYRIEKIPIMKSEFDLRPYFKK